MTETQYTPAEIAEMAAKLDEYERTLAGQIGTPPALAPLVKLPTWIYPLGYGDFLQASAVQEICDRITNREHVLLISFGADKDMIGPKKGQGRQTTEIRQFMKDLPTAREHDKGTFSYHNATQSITEITGGMAINDTSGNAVAHQQARWVNNLSMSCDHLVELVCEYRTIEGITQAGYKERFKDIDYISQAFAQRIAPVVPETTPGPVGKDFGQEIVGTLPHERDLNTDGDALPF